MRHFTDCGYAQGEGCNCHIGVERAKRAAKQWAGANKKENKEPYAFGPAVLDTILSSESRIKQSNPKDAIGARKPPHSTVSQAVMAEVGVGMLEGSIKYGRHNYRAIGVRAEVYYDAARRHIDAWWEGEDIDPDSGLSHITKAICSLVVLRDAMIQGKLFDDRPPPTPLEHKQYVVDKTDEVFKRYEGKTHERPYIKGGRMGDVALSSLSITEEAFEDLRVTSNKTNADTVEADAIARASTWCPMDSPCSECLDRARTCPDWRRAEARGDYEMKN